MSRKTLLTETEVRQFLKLASIGPLGDAKLHELYGEVPGARDEEDPPEFGAADDDADLAMAVDDEDEFGTDELGDDELGDDELDAPADAVSTGMVSVEDFMSALENALEDVLNDDVAVEMDDEEDALDDESALDDEDPLAADAMDTGMPPDEEEEPVMEEAIMNEVAKRVVARLKQKQSKESMVDALSERIMKRLTSK